jgi:ketosteroid isomerase-like protein
MGTVADHKNVALAWLRACLAVNEEHLLELTHEDCEFFLVGDLPGSGWKSREEWLAGWRDVVPALPRPLVITVGAVTAEDDRVAVEAETLGVVADGKAYNNQYHFFFRIQDGKVREFKEYFDTLHVFHTFAIETVHGAGGGRGRESNLREVAETYTRP